MYYRYFKSTKKNHGMKICVVNFKCIFFNIVFWIFFLIVKNNIFYSVE